MYAVGQEKQITISIICEYILQKKVFVRRRQRGLDVFDDAQKTS